MAAAGIAKKVQVLLLCGALCASASASAYARQPQQKAVVTERTAAGDEPENPGPLATDLSPRLTHRAIRKAMRKVADWQLRESEEKFNQQWTYAPLYDGLLAASRTTGDRTYHDAVLHAAEKFDWKLELNRFPHADDQALALPYIELYKENRDTKRIAATREVMDRLVVLPDQKKLLWWWCDALFMAPPVLANLSAITKDGRYLDYMDREWRRTSSVLYDPQQKLFSRDESFLDRKEANGEKLFWSRGNGWVLAGLAEIMSVMPKSDSRRPFYEKQFTDMAGRVAELQGKDGLWRSGLLDEDAYAQPEVSGSAFFAYAMAWGINNGLLDKAKFAPVVEHAWDGMLRHVYADGRLGSIQPIGAAPDAFKPGSSYVYGVGAFLLAGSQIDLMAQGHSFRGMFKHHAAH